MYLRSLLPIVLLATLTAPAQAQLTPWADLGFYRLVNDATGSEALTRLEVLQGAGTPPLSGLVLQVTLFRDDGRFTVYAGSIARGGLNIPFVNLQEVEDPLEFLRDLEGPLAASDILCQIPLLDFKAEMTFSCQSRNGDSWGASGRLIPHRPPAAPHLRSARP